MTAISVLVQKIRITGGQISDGKARLDFDGDAVRRVVFEGTPHRPPVLSLADHPHGALLRTVAEDAVGRLLLTSLEREIRRDL